MGGGLKKPPCSFPVCISEWQFVFPSKFTRSQPQSARNVDLKILSSFFFPLLRVIWTTPLILVRVCRAQPPPWPFQSWNFFGANIWISPFSPVSKWTFKSIVLLSRPTSQPRVCFLCWLTRQFRMNTEQNANIFELLHTVQWKHVSALLQTRHDYLVAVVWMFGHPLVVIIVWPAASNYN